MKYPSEHLFRLIKSLTKSEKRHFRKQALSHKKQRKYLKIFEAIDSQSRYNEKLIKKQFEEEGWVNRFNSAKEYLNIALMECLISYNRKNESQYSLDSLLLSINILQKKGFYDHCSGLIEKGKKMARELDDLKHLLALLELESLNHAGGINPYNSEEILDEQQNALKMLQNEYEYNRLYKKSFSITAKAGLDEFNGDELNNYGEIIREPLLKDISTALTFNARHLLKKQDRLTFMIDYAGLHHEINLLNKLGKFQLSAEKLVLFIQLGNVHKRELSSDIIMQHEYLMAYTRFGNNEFSQSKHHIENIISESNVQLRRDINKKARLLLLMIYSESGDLDLLEYSIRSTIRFFERNEIMNEMDKACFKLIRYSLDNFDNLERVHSELKNFKSNYGEKVHLVHDQIVNWIESKEKRVSFVEIIKETR